MIAVLFANGFEEIEALTPVDILRRAGFKVVSVGVSDKVATGSHGIAYTTDVTTDEFDFSEKIECLILPGGMPGSSNLDASPFTDKIIEKTLNDGGRISAICAAPFVLGKRGLLRNKRACCYPGFEKFLLGANVCYDGVVTDGQFTTARGMGVALDFALELLARLTDDETAEKMAKSIIYR
ncbi:MAG: DJ-1/PfpI family protein [Clostridia bacterium]|nr:DJ-1/PfpI family protein [Clostridia bacterium]